MHFLAPACSVFREYNPERFDAVTEHAARLPTFAVEPIAAPDYLSAP